MKLTIEKARKILEMTGNFFEDWDSDDEEKYIQSLNMNDTWGWACAWCQPVADEELIEVASLFIGYGYPGVLYWVSKKNDNMRSEFEDINRFVDFVANEERIKQDHPDSDERAYYKCKYTLG